MYRTLVYLLPPLMIGAGILLFALLLNYWPYAQGVVITTNPTDHSN
jgi:hypothetical protein